jgi:hypothetical protein
LAEGTAGFFITEGGNTKRLLLVTARHVIFTPDKSENNHFERKNNSQPRYNVMLFSDGLFNKHLESIQAEIEGKVLIAQFQERRIKVIEGKDDPAANKEHQMAQVELGEMREAMELLNTFYQDVSTRWATSESRVLGHVILSPPINVGVGSEGYTEDWAIIEIDASKVNTSNFNGNVNLGTHISVDEFTRMIDPNPRNVHSFTYPSDRLLMLKGTIPDEKMRHTTALDENNDPCLMVIKHGNTSGLTVGRANNIYSYVRNYYDGANVKTSKEWAISPFDSKSGAFSVTRVLSLLTASDASAASSLAVLAPHLPPTSPTPRPSASSSGACTTKEYASPTSTRSSPPRRFHHIDSTKFSNFSSPATTSLLLPFRCSYLTICDEIIL